MAEDFTAIEAWAADLLSAMGEGERRGLIRRIMVKLRSSQSRRIARQQNPDGSRYEPRKKPDKKRRRIRDRAATRSGRIRERGKGPMFRRLRTPKFLSIETDADQGEVGFSGAAARIGLVHQEGRRDRVSRRQGAPEVQYPARVLLGFTEEERAMIMDMILDHAIA